MTELFLKNSFTVRTGLVADPQAKHIRGMRQAVWLYLFLLAAVNPSTAERLIDPVQVAKSMGLTEGTVRSWLGQLRKKGYVACRREGPGIWVRVVRWKTADAKVEESLSGAKAESDLKAALTVQSLAKALGESSRNPLIAQLVATYNTETIRSAFEEVMLVPEERIKKSRLHFLVYLLKKSK